MPLYSAMPLDGWNRGRIGNEFDMVRPQLSALDLSDIVRNTYDIGERKWLTRIA